MKRPLPMIKVADVMPQDKASLKCAPHLSLEHGSCIPLDILIKNVESYNKYCDEKQSNDKIHVPEELIGNEPEHKKYMLFELKKRVRKNQIDWADAEFSKYLDAETKQELKENVFRPKGPDGRYEWLSTVDINKVMKQYESKYADFQFLGAVPIDFMELDDLPFKTLNFDTLTNSGITRFAVIFNTDKSYQRGKHWIVLYCDLKKGYIYFSDSVGIKPPTRVKKFMKIVRNYLVSKGITNLDIRYNKTERQKGNSECGVFCLNVVAQLLKGKSFNKVCKEKYGDRVVNMCRPVYFSNANFV